MGQKWFDQCKWALQKDFSFVSGCGNWKDEARQVRRSYRGCGRDAQSFGRNWLWTTEVCNAVVKDGKVPEDWSRSWMVNVYKGKGEALTCGTYRGIKLLEHAMKVLKRVIERR